MKTIVIINDKKVAKIREFHYTDRHSVFALIDALTSYAECPGIDDGCHLVIAIRGED